MSTSRKTATVADVARHAGVAVSTVSNVLNHPERLRGDTLMRVQKSIDALGFVRNNAARQVRLGSSLVLGLILVDSSLPFYWRLASAVEEGGLARGYSVLVANTNQLPERQERHVNLFESQRTEGVIATPMGDHLKDFEHLQHRGTPVVLIDYPLPLSNFSVVRVDHHAGGTAAAKHLLQIGRRKLALMRGPSGFPQIDERYRGAVETVATHPSAMVQWLSSDSLGLEAGHRFAEEIFTLPAGERPDAVFAPNDIAAIGVIQRLKERGILVPEDIAVVGYDDAVYPSSIGLSLTTVRQPTERLGSAAVDLLFERVDDPNAPHRSVDFVPELIVRESTSGRSLPSAH